tara:strand:+ start:300 stop:479 length:180 start_codon:yes stop_codon:yes gene_type:complete
VCKLKALSFLDGAFFFKKSILAQYGSNTNLFLLMMCSMMDLMVGIMVAEWIVTPLRALV